jgi:proline iminopeptidase
VATLVTSDGVKVFYTRVGQGPRVYVCGGGPANDHRYLADDLAPFGDQFEFVFHDYRGSGESETAADDTYSFARLADDLDELRKEIGDDEIAVLGHSLGGFVATTYALHYPKHCASVVLVGTFPTGIPRRMLPPMFRALGPLRTVKLAARLVWWLAVWSWRPRTEARRRRLHRIWSTWQEGLRPVRKREAEREVRLGLPLANDNIKSLQRAATSSDLSAQLTEIACPVLVLYGDRDAAAVWSADVYRAEIRDVEIVALPAIGHDPLFEAPTASVRALRSFVDRTRG